MYKVLINNQPEGVVYKKARVWAWRPEGGRYAQLFSKADDLSNVKCYLEYTYPDKKVRFKRIAPLDVLRGRW